MSDVTQVLVSVEVMEPASSIDRLLASFSEDDVALRSLTGGRAAEMWGGTKRAECRLYGGAFNYLDWRTLREFIEDIPWQFPGAVQVFVQRQNDSTFAVWRLVAGELDRPVDPIRLD